MAIEQVTERVFVYDTYPGCGIVVTDGGVIAIDGPMRPTEANEWGGFIRSKGTLKYQVYTEHHQDHITSGWFLKPEAIVASEVTVAEFRKSLPSVAAALQTMREYDPEVTDEALDGYTIREPEITYQNRLTLRLGDERFVIFRAPGHTRGSSVVHAVDQRVAFVADLFTLALHSADIWGWFATLGVLEALDVDSYVLGHGQVVAKRDKIDEFRGILVAMIERGREVKATTGSRDEFTERGAYILGQPLSDPTGQKRPERIETRARMLRKKGVENLYDYLNEHPSGPARPHVDPEFPIVF